MKKILLFTVLAFNFTNANAQWEQTNGPYCGRLLCLTINGSNIFIGTDKGVFYSNNNGKLWEQKNEGITEPIIWALAFDGSNLFAGGWTGEIYLSKDNGDSWETVYNQFPMRFMRSIVFNGSDIFASLTDEGVFLSTDYGKTWTAKNNGLTRKRATTLLTYDSIIYAGTDSGVFLSLNYGKNWKRINNGFKGKEDLIVNSLVKHDSFIYAATSGGILISHAGDTIWKSINNELKVTSLIITDSTFFAGTVQNGVYRSEDMGKTWTQVNNNLMCYQITSLAVKDSFLFAGTQGGGVYLSTNKGNDWTCVSNGISFSTCSALATSNNKIFATDYGVFVSEDSGKNWSGTSAGLTHPYVRAIFIDDSAIFIGTYGGGIFTSTNQGKSWTEKNNGIATTSRWANQFIKNGSDVYAETNAFLYKTNDKGATWTVINENGLPNLGGFSLLSVGNNVYAGSHNTSQGVFILANNGNNWQAINNGYPKDYTLFLERVDSNIFAATEKSGVYMFSKTEKKWIQRNEGLPNKKITALISKDTIIFAGTGGNGVYFSNDLGIKWNQINMGILNAKIVSLAVNDSFIFAGVEQSGVWKRQLSEIGVGQSEVKNKMLNNKIYPNPNNGKFHVDLGMLYPDIEVIVHNLMGQVVLKQKYTSTSMIELEINETSGLYFISLQTPDGQAGKLKVIIE